MLNFSKEDPWKINHFGIVKINEIKKETVKYVDEWLVDTSRQKTYKTHEDTFMYQLKELDYNWNMVDKIKSTSPNNFKTKKSNDEIEEIYKKLESIAHGKVVRSELINMAPNSRIRTHKDKGELLYASRRFHIPIVTNDKCVFIVEKESFYLKESNVYELNNRKYHSVENYSDKNRIHLIIDILPNAYIENIDFL
jgi:aspartyl/asparaginyl beta-hydroxylase (cupin superfamily)